MQKILLAAAAVVTLAAPAVSMAQPYYDGWRGGYREPPRIEAWRYEQRREAFFREERQREEWRREHWRAEHRWGYYGYRPY